MSMSERWVDLDGNKRDLFVSNGLVTSGHDLLGYFMISVFFRTIWNTITRDSLHEAFVARLLYALCNMVKCSSLSRM